MFNHPKTTTKIKFGTLAGLAFAFLFLLGSKNLEEALALLSSWVNLLLLSSKNVSAPNNVTLNNSLASTTTPFTASESLNSVIAIPAPLLDPTDAIFPALTDAIDPPNPTFPEPSEYKEIPYRGINLAGGDFDSGFQLPYPADALYFIQKGMNTVRLPFKWEYVQSDFSQPIDFSSGNAQQISVLVDTLTAANITVILDMHNYMRYNNQIIGASAVNTTNYANAWGNFGAQFKGNNLVFFDLMNEPNTMPTELILTNYNAAISSIRAAGFSNTLLLEGNAWSGINSWTQNWYGTSNALVFVPSNITDPQNNYWINVHEYFTDPDGGGSGIGDCVDPNSLLEIEQFSTFVEWLEQQDLTAFLTETSGEATTNCIADIDEFLTAVEQNPVNNNRLSGFIGYTLWAGGHAWQGSNYPLDLAPNSDGSEQPQMREAVDHHLTPPPALHSDEPVLLWDANRARAPRLR